jgi:uncharacterized membrane protein
MVDRAALLRGLAAPNATLCHAIVMSLRSTCRSIHPLQAWRPMTRNVAVSRSKAGVGDDAGLTNALVATAATIGVVIAGAALLEVALIPGVLIGGTAVLAPQYLPKLGRGVRSLFTASFQRRVEPAVSLPVRTDISGALVPAQFTVKQAIAKTITFRVIVTTLDFTVNYVVLGEFATAAGLSAFALVAGPLFYLAHETAWNHFGDADRQVDLTVVLPLRPDSDAPARAGFAISRALAKTITYRTIATIVDFSTNYVVVGDLVTAVGLSASGFILGPFVYLGHEMLWDRYGSPEKRRLELTPLAGLLPAPG